MNKLRILYSGRFKQGTLLPDIARMVNYSHPEVEFIPYNDGESKGDILMEFNATKAKSKEGMRRLVFIGSIPSLMKRNNIGNWDKVDHVFYISDFCKNIVEASFKSKQNSSHLLFGGLPSDDDMQPLMNHREIDGPIQFLAVAKWYKRPYKRLNQIVKLYRDYLKVEYPDSILNVIGVKTEYVDDGVYYYRKTFHNPSIIDIFKNSHIQLIPTPFDTGPKTISESLHYRVPFVCSNNCAGKEYINKLGKCGIDIETDPFIDSHEKYKLHKPLNVQGKKKFHKNPIPYEKYFEAVRGIVNNFKEYTSWEWNEKFNYEDQSDQLYNMLKGN
jgi:hypothetical protein